MLPRTSTIRCKPMCMFFLLWMGLAKVMLENNQEKKSIKVCIVIVVPKWVQITSHHLHFKLMLNQENKFHQSNILKTFKKNPFISIVFISSMPYISKLSSICLLSSFCILETILYRTLNFLRTAVHFGAEMCLYVFVYCI